jgi:hypothetical protein
MRTIDLRASHSGLEPVVPKLSIDTFLTGVVVQVSERFDGDAPIVECRQTEKQAATRQVDLSYHEFKVVDLSGCLWRTPAGH